MTERLRIEPLTRQSWSGFEDLFGSRGACGGCWCMTPRLPRAQYERQKGEGNRRAMKAIVTGGEIPGIVGFLADEAVAWCAVGPRERFSWLDRSRLFQPIDKVSVWSIVCLFIDKEYRRQGLSVQMIDAACSYAAGQGARCIEAYPVEPKTDSMPAAFAYYGLANAYRRVGFHEVARRSETRPMMRRELDTR